MFDDDGLREAVGDMDGVSDEVTVAVADADGVDVPLVDPLIVPLIVPITVELAVAEAVMLGVALGVGLALGQRMREIVAPEDASIHIETVDDGLGD